MEVTGKWLFDNLRWTQGIYILRPKNDWTMQNCPWKIGVSKSTIGLARRISEYKTALVRYEVAYVIVYKNWERAEKAERRLHRYLTDELDVKRKRFINTLQSEWFDCPLPVITKALKEKIFYHEEAPFIVYDWSDGKELKYITPKAPSQKVARAQRLFDRKEEKERKEKEMERNKKLLASQAKAKATRQANKRKREMKLLNATKKKPELSERTRRLLKRQEAQVTADKAEQRKQMRIQRLLRNLS